MTDPFPRVAGPTGRGLTADIITFSHPDGQGTFGLTSSGSKKKSGKRDDQRVPTSLEPAFLLDSPGEYEVHQVLVTGVRTFRDDDNGAQRGENTCFVYELDGVHIAHLGDIGHLLTQDEVEEIGALDVVCVPIGGALPAARAAELVAQLGANLIVPMALDESGNGRAELDRFLHEMSVQHGEPVPKLAVMPSSVPGETTVVLLEARNRS
ncbi:MBL fold metallo-hydrolase [soil metagenome]